MGKGLAELLAGRPAFINIGVREFAESLRKGGFEVCHVEWTPPAGGDREMADLLDRLL